MKPQYAQRIAVLGIVLAVLAGIVGGLAAWDPESPAAVIAVMIAIAYPLILGSLHLHGYAWRQDMFDALGMYRWLVHLREAEPDPAIGAPAVLPGGAGRRAVAAGCLAAAAVAVVAVAARRLEVFVVAFAASILLAYWWGWAHRWRVVLAGERPRVPWLRLAPRGELPETEIEAPRYSTPGALLLPGLLLLPIVGMVGGTALWAAGQDGGSAWPLVLGAWMVLPLPFAAGSAVRQLEASRTPSPHGWRVTRPLRVAALTGPRGWRAAAVVTGVLALAAGVVANRWAAPLMAAVVGLMLLAAAVTGYLQRSAFLRSGVWPAWFAIRFRGDVPAGIRALADDDIDAFADRLIALRERTGEAKVPPAVNDDYVRAVRLHQRVYEEVERIASPADLRPVAVLLEEGRWWLARAEARLAGEPPPSRTLPCFFDPAHGLSVSDVSWRPYSGELYRVRACRDDIARLVHGERPAIRTVEIGGWERPHWLPHAELDGWNTGYYAGAELNAEWLDGFLRERRFLEAGSHSSKPGRRLRV